MCMRWDDSLFLNRCQVRNNEVTECFISVDATSSLHFTVSWGPLIRFPRISFSNIGVSHGMWTNEPENETNSSHMLMACDDSRSIKTKNEHTNRHSPGFAFAFASEFIYKFLWQRTQTTDGQLHVYETMYTHKSDRKLMLFVWILVRVFRCVASTLVVEVTLWRWWVKTKWNVVTYIVFDENKMSGVATIPHSTEISTTCLFNSVRWLWFLFWEWRREKICRKDHFMSSGWLLNVHKWADEFMSNVRISSSQLTFTIVYLSDSDTVNSIFNSYLSASSFSTSIKSSRSPSWVYLATA